MNPYVQNPPPRSKSASRRHLLPVPAPQAAGVPTDRSSSVGWKPYNQSHMQTASSARLPDGFMAAIWLGAEKPHQGVSTKNQAWQPAPNVCNSTTALGLRAGCVGNRVRSFCSGEQYDQDLGLYYLRARYYNPATGRFLSRDPEDGNAKIPATLHKYLYVGGNPVNWVDPRGRFLAEYDEIAAEEDVVSREIFKLGVELALCYAAIADVLEESLGWKNGIVAAAACSMPFWPGPPPPPEPPPPLPPPPPPPEPPFPWPPPGTPIN